MIKHNFYLCFLKFQKAWASSLTMFSRKLVILSSIDLLVVVDPDHGISLQVQTIHVAYEDLRIQVTQAIRIQLGDIYQI